MTINKKHLNTLWYVTEYKSWYESEYEELELRDIRQRNIKFHIWYTTLHETTNNRDSTQ